MGFSGMFGLLGKILSCRAMSMKNLSLVCVERVLILDMTFQQRHVLDCFLVSVA